MRLTDFCTIFAALFVCLFLGRDLLIGGLCEQQTAAVIADRQMDRIAEDALMDVVETENADGTPQIRSRQVYEQYRRLFSEAYELTEDDCRLRAWEAVTLWQLRSYPYAISAQELDVLRDSMEQQINTAKRQRREATRLMLSFPYRSNEDWQQTLSGTQLLTVLDPREPFAGYDRAVFSGSRIVKRMDR